MYRWFAQIITILFFANKKKTNFSNNKNVEMVCTVYYHFVFCRQKKNKLFKQQKCTDSSHGLLSLSFAQTKKRFTDRYKPFFVSNIIKNVNPKNAAEIGLCKKTNLAKLLRIVQKKTHNLLCPTRLEI